MMRHGVLLLGVFVFASVAAAQQAGEAPAVGIDFAFWADRFETQMDVLSVLSGAERQGRFVDSMREWRGELMPIMFAFRQLTAAERREVGGQLFQQLVSQVGEARLSELRSRWEEEMAFQVAAFQSLDDAGRRALLNRFWSPGPAEEPDLRAELGLGQEEWDIVGELIEQIRALQKEMGEALSPIRRELRKLLNQPDTPAKELAGKLDELRKTAQRYQVRLAALRESLRQLLSLKQEAQLIVAGILE